MNTLMRFKIPLAMSLLVAMGMAYIPSASADQLVVTEKRSIKLCGDLFEIDANADKLSAGERARIVQANLDNALIKATNRTPSAVQVRMKNGLPVVELDGFHIVTADSNSAERNNMSRMELAQSWADKIKMCLAEEDTVEKYVSALEVREPVASAIVEADKDIAVVPAETKLPVKLASGFYYDGATIGDAVTAVLSRDVPLGPSFKTYLPKGTLAHGKVVSADIYAYNGFPNADAVTIEFTSLETPDGQEIPISAHIFGKQNEFFRADSRQLPDFRPLDRYRDEEAPERFIVEEPQAEPQGMLTLNDERPAIARGLITGAWLGEGYSKRMQHLHTQRLFMDKGATFSIAPDEELQLETTATTSIAIATPVEKL